MNAIKLPVRMVEIGCGEAFVTDDAGVTHNLSDRELAAALNAAPTRAFGELTPKMIGLMVNDVVREVGERHENATVQEYSDWQKRCDEAMLSRLQAFAASLRSEERAEARRAALEEAAQLAEACDSPFSCPTDEQHEAVDLMARRIAGTIRDRIDQPVPAAVGSYLGSDDSDCGNG